MKMNKKMLVAASIAGLMASSAVAMAGSAFPGQDAKKSCCSMNKCSGKNSCKGAKNSCGGHKNGCKAECAVNKTADAAAKIEGGKLTS